MLICYSARTPTRGFVYHTTAIFTLLFSRLTVWPLSPAVLPLQVYDFFPAVKQYYPFQVENEWNGYPWATFCLETMAIPFLFSAVYFVGIFGTQVQWLFA